MQAVYASISNLPTTVNQQFSNLLDKIPNPVTVAKNTEWKQLANKTAVKIKEFSKEIFKTLVYGLLIKLSPCLFVPSVVVGLAYPQETSAAISRVVNGLYNAGRVEKCVIAAAAFLGLPLTAPISTFMIGAHFGAQVASSKNAEGPANPAPSPEVVEGT